MHEQPSKSDGSGALAVDHIAKLAQGLRDAEHLDPAARLEMADLLRALALELERGETSEHEEHLAHTTTQLLGAVHEQHEPSRIEAARGRLDDALLRVEAKAPMSDIVVSIAYILSGIGI